MKTNKHSYIKPVNCCYQKIWTCLSDLHSKQFSW